MEIEEMPIHVASLEDLVAMKKQANRETDKSDIIALEKIQKTLRDKNDAR